MGGCVRDLLLGRKPKDFDVATSATPPEIKALFRNCRIIGRRFRLAHIFFGPKIIETSTFRANPREVEADDDADAARRASSGHGDNELYIRRDNVFGIAEEDARRRDFTINGLFYDLDDDKVIDYVEGLPDLERRTVRTIGDPDDPLPRRSDPHPARASSSRRGSTSRSSRRPTRRSSRTRARSPSARRRACSRRSIACCAAARRGARSSCCRRPAS